MPTLQDEDQDQRQQAPDDGGWNTDVGGEDNTGGYDWAAGENDLLKPDSDGYDGQNPPSKARNPDENKSGLDGDGLIKAEEGSAGGPPNAVSGALPGEKGKLDQASFDAGKTVGASGATSRFGKIKAVVQSRRGGGAIVGGVFAIMMVLLGVSSGSLDMEHYKNNLLNNVNKGSNRVMTRRRSRAIVRAIKRYDRKLGEKAIANGVKELEGKGFKFTFATDGDIKSGMTQMDFTDSGGTTHSFDATKPNFNDNYKSFLDDMDSVARNEFLEGMTPNKRLAGEVARGPTASSWFRRWRVSRDSSRMNLPPDDPNATLAEDLEKKILDQADELDNEPISGVAGEFSPVDENGDPIESSAVDEARAGVVDDTGKLTGGSSGAADALEEADGKAQIISDNADNIVGELKAKNLAGLTAEAAKVSDNIGPEVAKKSVLAGVDPLFVAQQACHVKGALSRIDSVRRFAYAIEVMRFGMKWIAFADSRKAGYSTGKANALMELWMHRPNKTTGQSFGTGGALANVNGDKTVHANPALITRFSGGFASAGILAAISNFLKPFTGTCKVANNTFLNIGVGIISIGAAIISGGSITVGTVAAAALPLLAIVLAQEIITQIATPILIRTGAHLVMSGLDSGDILEAAVTSGAVGGLMGINNSKSLAPVTKEEHKIIAMDAEIAERQRFAKESIYERYFNTGSQVSLLGNLRIRLATAVKTIRDTGPLNYAASISRGSKTKLSRTLFPTTYAQTESTSLCEDPQALKYNLETDDFCNLYNERAPDLDIDETETLLLKNNDIDLNGDPISARFKAYIKQCVSGAPGMMYKNDVANNGNDTGDTDMCVSAGPVLAGATKTMEEAYSLADYDRPTIALWQKVLGNTAYAEPTFGNSTVGAYPYFSAWMGYLDDMGDRKQSLTGVYSENIPTGGTAPTTGGPSTVNAPGLNGYTIPCTGIPSTAKITGARPDAINWNAIPDSGTIGTASDGAPIKVYIREPCDKSNAKTVTIVSSIHGTENEGQGISFELLFKKNLPQNMRVIAVPELNHAGINQDPGRINANQVNLNRNFSYSWSAIPPSADNNYSGPSANSEPETIAIQQFLGSISDNNLLIAYHDDIHYIVASTSLGLPASKAYFDYVVAHGVTGFTNIGGKQETAVVSQPGSMDAWYGTAHKKPALLIEMKPTTTDAETNTHADAIIHLVNTGVLE